MILEKLLKITNALLMPNISEFIQMMDTESVQNSIVSLHCYTKTTSCSMQLPCSTQNRKLSYRRYNVKRYKNIGQQWRKQLVTCNRKKKPLPENQFHLSLTKWFINKKAS